jgi:hypothetical protein
MLSRVVYNQADEPDDDGWEEPDPDDDRQRMIALFALSILGAVLGGLALGFVIDFLRGRL